MNKWLKKFRQAICLHRFHASVTKTSYDWERDIMHYEETCMKCGKKFSFSIPWSNLLNQKGSETERDN